MPIKFRCQHCRQFLGISRGKASAIVDCPKCGRSIRVPDLDGNVRPLPKPGLNLKDSDLRDALAELANIGQAAEIPQSLVEDEDFNQKLGKPEVIELQPVAQAKPIDVAIATLDAPAAKPVDEDRGWRTTRQADDAWKAVVEMGEGDSSDQPVASSEASTSAKPETAPRVEHDRPVPTLRSMVNPSSIVAVVGVAALIFTGGFWIGRVTAIRSEVAASASGTGTGANGTENSNNSNKAAVGNASLRGRITYVSDAGSRKPDKGARVLVLPTNWSGKAKLKLDGFRLGDSEQDRRVAKASIQAMGGDYVTTDDSGEYAASLNSTGQFHVIALSNSLSRADTDDIKPVETLVAQYFERPAQLIGRVSAYTETVKHSGPEPTPWDHSFQRE